MQTLRDKPWLAVGLVLFSIIILLISARQFWRRSVGAPTLPPQVEAQQQHAITAAGQVAEQSSAGSASMDEAARQHAATAAGSGTASGY